MVGCEPALGSLGFPLVSRVSRVLLLWGLGFSPPVTVVQRVSGTDRATAAVRVGMSSSDTALRVLMR